MNLYAQRLLNVARALRETPSPEFDMSYYYADRACQTPGCALGHYHSRTDLNEGFSPDSLLLFTNSMPHFGLTKFEAAKLFDSDGCGDAKTPEEAAAYIEAFVAKKYGLKSTGVPVIASAEIMEEWEPECA